MPTIINNNHKIRKIWYKNNWKRRNNGSCSNSLAMLSMEMSNVWWLLMEILNQNNKL